MWDNISIWQLAMAAVIGCGVVLLIAGPAGFLAGSLLANIAYGAFGAALGSGLFLGAKAIGFKLGQQGSVTENGIAIEEVHSDSRDFALSVINIDNGVNVTLDNIKTQNNLKNVIILAEESQRSANHIREQLKLVLGALPPAISDQTLTVKMDKDVLSTIQQEIDNTLREMGRKINVEVTQ